MTNVTRTFDILDRYHEMYGNKSDVLAVKRSGKWETFSLEDYRKNVDLVSLGLLAMNIKPGDKIATVSNNRPEWNFMDMGIAQIGAVHVPIYPTISAADYLYILKHADIKIIVVSDAQLYAKILPIMVQLEHKCQIFTFNNITGAKHFSEILKAGESVAEERKNELVALKNEVKPENLMTIIYTSGTTGEPKGVMLSHTNFISNVLDTYTLLKFGAEGKALSFLPLCHVLERMVNYLYQYNGVSIYYAESNETIVENLNEVHPDVFVTVPRLLEKVYDKILNKGKSLKGIARKIFYWAIDMALKFELNNANGWLYAQQLKIADKLVYSKWRAAIGGNVKLIIVGGAALQPRLARTFWAAGIKVQEGYGLTETSPVVSVNQDVYPFVQFGTVGPVLKNTKVKIADDGEILVKGPNVMLGYYKDEARTAEAIDADGWFHTGDIGELSSANILKITDRKKEIFKLSGGKYIAPQALENKLKESIFIEQCMVVGENEKFAAALLSPNFEFLHDWCARHQVHYRDNIDLIEDSRVLERYQEEIDNINKELGQTETIKKFLLVCEEWTPDNGCLSPTLKVKRKHLKAKYKIKLDRLYGYTNELGHVLTSEQILASGKK